MLAARKAGSLHSHSTRAACPPVRERRKQRHTVIILSLKYIKPRRFFFPLCEFEEGLHSRVKIHTVILDLFVSKAENEYPAETPHAPGPYLTCSIFHQICPYIVKGQGDQYFPTRDFQCPSPDAGKRVALKWEGGETKSLHNPYHCLQQWLKD